MGGGVWEGGHGAQRSAAEWGLPADRAVQLAGDKLGEQGVDGLQPLGALVLRNATAGAQQC